MMNTARKQAGSSLIEGMISILIFSVGVLGLAHTQTFMLASGKQAEFRIQATALASELAGLAQADPDNAGCYAGTSDCSEAASAYIKDWVARAQAQLPGATEKKPVVALNSGVLSVTLQWQRKGEDTWHNYSVRTSIFPGA